MSRTLAEAIKHSEELAEENQRVVDTGIVFDAMTIDMLYCDDTEVIAEHLANYQRCADEHRQLAEWLKDYKRLKEKESCEDAISREDVLDAISRIGLHKSDTKEVQAVAECLRAVEALMPAASQSKTGHWIECDILQEFKCSECRVCFRNKSNYCPNCGVKMIEQQAESEE